MTTENANVRVLPKRPILSFLKDIPNICSLAGLGCTLLAIYFLITGVYAAAMIGMIWAVAFDWADGLIVVFTMLVFGAIRLSYFSTFGLSDDQKYTGLAIDNNSIILVLIFTCAGYFEQSTFSIILAACGLFLAVLNVSQIKTPKLSGNPINVAILAAYTLAVTAFYGSTLL